MIKGHGGNIYETASELGCRPEEIVDMSSNVNPLGPLPELMSYLQDNIQVINALPEPDAFSAIKAFAGNYDLDPGLILAGNGTTQFIYSLPLALNMHKALILGPTYSDYADACALHRVDYEFLLSTEDNNFEQDISQVQQRCRAVDTVFICNPNNPTGTLIPSGDLLDLVKKNPETCFIIDESYLPFVSKGQTRSLMGSTLPNLIVLNSMSKIFRIPGLRIGFLISGPEIIQKVRAYLQPWSVNSLAQATLKFLMGNSSLIRGFEQKTRDFLDQEKKVFQESLRTSEFVKIFPSTTSFLLLKLQTGITAGQICRFFMENKVLIRNCANFKGLSESFIRVSLKDSQNNKYVAEKLASLKQC